MSAPKDDHIIEGTLAGVPFSLSCRTALEISVANYQRVRHENASLMYALRKLPKAGDISANDAALIELRGIVAAADKGAL